MGKIKTIIIYWEFDPRDHESLLAAKRFFENKTNEMYGASPNKWVYEISRVPNYAELHYYKSELTIPETIKTHWE
jgi:hypothetical protein